MGTNLVLCCDGTSNEFSRDNTNVVRLFQVLESVKNPGVRAGQGALAYGCLRRTGPSTLPG